ncbi:MAG: hypothetical protein [Bacteriophage sp.]|nr:MAG: hypothetical protein [Bacteriophage sp.]UVX47810.1 MAG: hypothetical protein [Bacteriophage sp.]UVX88148.1 MAG: hypothetical protein [Bacteriophage sp.]
MGVKKGMVNNPTGKGGFGDHPENACRGRWRKEDSYTYNVNKYGRMTDIELQEVILQAKGGELTQFQRAALQTVLDMQKREGWKKLVDTVDRVDGKALQPVEQTVNGYVPPTINIEFVKGDEDEE